MLALLAATVLGSPSPVLGQNTGGSFGGSRWNSGGGSSPTKTYGGGGSYGGGSYGGGSGGRTNYGGGSYSGGGGYGTYTGGKGGGGLCGTLCVLGVIVAAVIIVAALKKRQGARGMGMAPPPGPGPYGPSYGPPMGGPGGPYGGPMGGAPTESFSLAAMAIAFDHRARAAVQGELDRIAGSVNMNAPDGLSQATRMVAEALSRHLDYALMTQQAVSTVADMSQAQQMFQNAVDQERGRYMVETVRADAGGVRKVEGPKMTARAEEGGGWVVVTLVVCRRGVLTNLVPVTDRNSLAHDLQVLLAGPGALQAFEIVWIPSNPSDVMSSAEMAVKFPTLKPIAPDARVGRRACEYCKSVFAAELGQCPSCGARV